MRNPNYAIVKIPEAANVVGFYQLLLEHGFAEVSFVNEVRENAFLPHSEIETPVPTKPSLLQNIANGESKTTRTGSPMDTTNSTPCVPARTNLLCDTRLPKIKAMQEARCNTNVQPSTTASSFLNNCSTRPRGLRNSAPAPNPQFTSNGSENGGEDAVYATCQLCQNKIMSTRLSNLTNHVRRHAAMKQYQCKHCSYSHNEMAKVRLHMHHNHGDFNSQPHDALCYEMQLQWGMLMEQCFPEHANRFGPSATVLCQNRDPQKFVQEDSTYTCVDCGEMVEGSKLVDHMREAHKKDCVPYACSECDYQSSTQWKVRLHISVKHAERAAEIPVNALSPGANYLLFLHRFFPEIPGEEDEERMVAQLRQNSDKRFDNTSTEDNSASEEGMEPTGNETTTCAMCEGSLLSCNPLSNLLVHAKRHYVVKQFKCPECTHACVDVSSMRIHISIKHPKADAVEPIDQMSEDLKGAWLDTMKKCFPHLKHRIEKYQFQHQDCSSPLSYIQTSKYKMLDEDREKSHSPDSTSSSDQTPKEAENDSQGETTYPLEEENSVISKSRISKRPLPEEDENKIKRLQKDCSRSPSPTQQLRNTRSRLADGAAGRTKEFSSVKHAKRK